MDYVAKHWEKDAEMRQRLLRTVKKEFSTVQKQVKQIMEEAVTRKFVHEDSSHIISFCAAVEACVLHGLRRRAAGFLRSNKIAALFMKVAKTFPLAEQLCRKVQELEQLIESRKAQGAVPQENTRKSQKVPSLSAQALKHLWIRTALFEKVLDKIVQHLVENSSKYYEKEALLMDPVDGPILGSLLVGPCALEYTKMKTADHFWTDPSADELVQRHRIHSVHCRQDSPTKRPALCIQKRHSSGSMDDRLSLSARDYVESLHQNSRATLLYGKNNVLVQPKDDMEPIPGYLSLHQTAETMTLKWTPNQLMNGSVGDLDYEKSVYWDYAMNIRLEEIVYLHCHQQIDSGGTVVLVSQDGIQRPPLRFPKGGHLLAFLSCLENGLLPRGQLDPPLWSQRGKGKVFPKLRKRSPPGSAESNSDKEEEEATDYVFRIIFPGTNPEIIPQDLMDVQGGGIPLMWQPNVRKSSCSSCSQSGSSDGGPSNGCNHERAPLKMLCDNMKYQILSRAFYGWLAYCRHLSTVRTHLSALVNHTIISPVAPSNAGCGLTREIWHSFLRDGRSYEEQELLRLIYYGGIEAEIRKEVWPFLLGHYQFGMSEAERKEVDDQIRNGYEQTMGEWMACEAVVRQRERESHAAALAKCSSAVSLDAQIQRMMHRDSTVSTESSQSCSSDRQDHARLQSDSSSSTQVFESVEDTETEQIEKEAGISGDKQVAAIPNGTVLNGPCYPDSGHPSLCSHPSTAGYSEHSFSTEEAKQLSHSSSALRHEGKLRESNSEEEPLPQGLPTQNRLQGGLRLQDELEADIVVDGSEVVPQEGELQNAIRASGGSEIVPKANGSEGMHGMSNGLGVVPKANGPEVFPKVDGPKGVHCESDGLEIIPTAEGSEVVPMVDGTEVVPTADGSEVVPTADGSEVVPTADGTEVVPTADGTEVVPTADGSEVVPTADGSEVVPTANGTEVVPMEDGTEVVPMEDGSEVVPTADGSEVVSMEDGTEVVPMEDGSEVVSMEDGTEVVPTADGSLVVSMEDGTEVVPTADGSLVVSMEDGTEVVPTADGSLVVSMEDGTEVVPMADGFLVVSMEDGTEVVPTADGSKVVPTADGSKVVPTADGSEVVPTADGSEVVPKADQLKSLLPVADRLEVPPTVDESKDVLCVSDGSEIVPMSESVRQEAPGSEGLGLEDNLPTSRAEGMVTEEGLPIGEGTEGLTQVQSMAESIVPVASPVSSTGVTYAQELLDMYTVNLHRIEKDVQRCDRNYWYFTPSNLEKLRNVMCSYIWQHLEIGYVQGMCDLLAPLLVVLDNEVMAFSCFTQLMKRMNQNFPHGGAMDTHFANMRSLIQILDSELFELMHQNGDYTHFYFCYRWFLLDFKRELVYDDVFSVWETIWAAKFTSSTHFVLFIALSMVELYRDIILENNMDFTDIIKFFNEMAEHHDVKQVLKLARDLVYKVQKLIENK
ncbi:small G protein signaling modulator 1 [Hypanus sabinus]|uniref:small G protein signaling modulator 1 n=1 Tax=Hypanus sabinus TaxID=79690 RepID=UPI0028C46D6D|nr:small G protein signaling modulator 1 [Hypanus sabinus]